jgi:hypothetical protein
MMRIRKSRLYWNLMNFQRMPYFGIPGQGANFLIDVFSLNKDLGTAMELSEVLSDFMMKHGGYIMQAVDFRCGREEK